jgi:hypothetical protein
MKNVAQTRAEVPGITGLTTEQVARLTPPTYTNSVTKEVTGPKLLSLGNDMLAFSFIRYIPSLAQVLWIDRAKK